MKKVFILALVLCILGLLTACKTSDSGIKYPDFPRTENNGTPSWEQGDKEPITIDWYVDRSTFYWAGAAGSDVSNMIYEKTGIKINFIVPLTDDGTKLNTILNSDKMPDLITLDINNTTRAQMQEAGYAYPLDGLAERWAPTLFENWSDEINYLFAAKDGNLYGVPSLYYSMDDLAAFDDQKSILQANASFIARKDYLEAYLNYASSNRLYDSFIGTTLDDFTISNSREAAEYAVTKASNFIEMCKWVKDTYGTAITSTILTDAFTTTEDNKGLYRLIQYFAVPRENADGTLAYTEAQPEFYESIKFLNECYREGLISDTNFSNTKQQQSNILQNGKCFVMMCCPQDYGTATREFTKKYLVDGEITKEYVGIVITDDEGTAPVMANLAGNGDTFTMVSKDCERPDRVIKLIDYLTSYEGQMLTYFGVENEHWYYEVEPGETVIEEGVSKTYKYGKVMWYDDVFEDISNSKTSRYGFLTFQLLRPNKAIAKLATYSGDEMYHFSTYLTYNMKAVVSDWLYNPKLLSIGSIRDSSSNNYLDICTKATMCQQKWRENLARIITQSTEEQCRQAYEATLLTVERLGYKEVLAYDNARFQQVKAKFGVSYVWAPLTEGYNPVKVKSIYGNTSYKVEIPDFIAKK